MSVTCWRSCTMSACMTSRSLRALLPRRSARRSRVLWGGEGTVSHSRIGQSVTVVSASQSQSYRPVRHSRVVQSVTRPVSHSRIGQSVTVVSFSQSHGQSVTVVSVSEDPVGRNGCESPPPPSPPPPPPHTHTFESDSVHIRLTFSHGKYSLIVG